MSGIKSICCLAALLLMLGIGLSACGEPTLSTKANPTAGGSITPDGGTYAKGLKVSVTATPNTGYRFDRWEGGASGSSPNVQVTMDSNTNLVAYFAKTFSVTVSSSPTQGGTITPAGGNFDEGNSVTLIATPAQYYAFNGWAGDGSGTNDHLTMKMDSNKQITASFVKKLGSLVVQSDPPGSGTTDPISGTYEAGSQKTVTASPATGYRFDHWGGGTSGTANPVNVIMDGNKNVTAYFTKLYTLTLAASPSDGGIINAKSGVYDAGTKVNLYTTPSFPYYLKNWIGADNNNAANTTVTMNNDTAVTAIFAQGTKGTTQKAAGNVYIDPRSATTESVQIQLNQFDWVQGEIIIVTSTPITPFRSYIQDPAGNLVKDFGSAAQTNFSFMAQTTGRYTVVFQNNSVWYAGYTLTYAIWGK